MMGTQNFNLKPIAGALLFSFTLPAFALHLGEPRNISYVGEQLRVDIPILDSTLEETKDMTVRSVAYPYARKFDGHPEYNISIRYENDKPVITINSPNVVNESVVDVAIEVGWAAGRVIQPVTLVLDERPASSSESKSAPVAELKPAQIIAADVKPVKELVVEQLTLVQDTKPAPVQRKSDVRSYGYKVSIGDTLYKIASRTKPSNVEIKDWADVIYRANPSAFVKSPNRLLANSNLYIPSHDSYSPNQIVVASVERTNVSHVKTNIKTSNSLVKSVGHKIAKPAKETTEDDVVKAETRVRELEQQVKDLTDQIKAIDAKMDKLKTSVKNDPKPAAPAQAKKSSMSLFEDKSKGLLSTLDAYRKLRSVV